MADQKISVRMKTPEDSSGERQDLFPITSSDEVIDTYSGRTLTDSIKNRLTVSTVKPDHPGFWFDITDD